MFSIYYISFIGLVYFYQAGKLLVYVNMVSLFTITHVKVIVIIFVNLYKFNLN